MLTHSINPVNGGRRWALLAVPFRRMLDGKKTTFRNSATSPAGLPRPEPIITPNNHQLMKILSIQNDQLLGVVVLSTVRSKPF